MKRHPSRLLILFIVFVGLWTVLVFRAAWIQLIPNSRLEALKRRQFETTVTLGHRRGDILDRNSHELAASAAAWSLFADPKLIADPRTAARRLAEIFQPSRKTYAQIRLRNSIYDRIKVQKKSPKRRFVWIERQIGLKEKSAIEALKIKGLGFIEEPRRIYPNEKLMANVLGFVGQEGRGLEGLELRLNESLSGARRKVSMQKDARGRPLLVNGQLFTEAPDGATIQLTIDRDLQFFVERELHEALETYEASAATAVVLDAQTSEILAMATLPTFNANEGARARPEFRRNRAVTDVFEPGSTMKTFVMAAAIDEKKIEPNSKVFGENGTYKIGKRIIREADSRHKFGWITATEALAYSSNIGVTKVAQLLGEERLREAYLRFGFGETSGVDLPGEARGTVQALPWREHLLANVSFGHGVSTTALQVANAYAVIANGGFLKKPYIVKSIRDPETGEVNEVQPKTLRRVLGEGVAAKVRLMLSATTIGDGTGKNARVAGFPVAGKTGTAQRVRDDGRGYEAGAYVASFAGFLPANDPKYVIFVSLDKPQKNYYGGSVAAPVFARIARYAVSRAGLSPVLISAKNVIDRNAAAKARNPKAEVAAWRTKSKLAVESESLVVPLEDAIRRELASGDALSAENSETTAADKAPVVPDVVGLSLREAMESFASSGISWRRVAPRGQGFVSKQHPPAGARWVDSRNRKIDLELTFAR